MGLFTAKTAAGNARLAQADRLEAQAIEANHHGDYGRANRLFARADRAQRDGERIEARAARARR